MSVRGHVRSENCPSGNYPSGTVLRGNKCLQGIIRRENVHWGTVLEPPGSCFPVNFVKNFKKIFHHRKTLVTTSEGLLGTSFNFKTFVATWSEELGKKNLPLAYFGINIK